MTKHFKNIIYIYIFLSHPELSSVYLQGLFVRIDASEDDGSMARLVNDEHISPNANMKVLHEGFAEPHLCIFAVNDIKAGEEIRYNYGRNIDYSWRKKVKKTYL